MFKKIKEIQEKLNKIHHEITYNDGRINQHTKYHIERLEKENEQYKKLLEDLLDKKLYVFSFENGETFDVVGDLIEESPSIFNVYRDNELVYKAYKEKMLDMKVEKAKVDRILKLC